MSEQEKKKQNKGGRNPKVNPAVHRYVFRLTDEENAKFLSLFETSGADNKAQFVTSLLFQKPIKSVKVDMAAMDYYTRLTTFFGQFRAVGVNYNQVVKILYRNFSEKKAAAYLFKLEKQTAELAKLCRDVMELTTEFEAKHLNKNSEK
ncbi:conjugal transfer protein MobA [Elizabethkingia miricola]|uniref:Conjugal transfer protein MobA n=2 Tax=Elizabethkingia TaxID=308865 RepID=A0ABD5B858_ELIMR|nr:conjugal transfer protein MobA [Elizabethkingia miricola]MBS1740499.1 hypothetical protein [Bacteroidota bacterium]MDQ8750079.1 conjugal transfer protein MobA [Elizabethkingia miricola]MDV3663221.1 hypothetical protein [Elizabethkingia anophelis]